MTALRDWERIVLGVTALDILRERRQRRSDAATQLLLRWISSVRFFESIPASTISTTLVDDLGVEAFAEAETIVKADLPADEAAANVAYLRDMLNRKDGPRTASRAAPGAPVVAKDD